MVGSRVRDGPVALAPIAALGSAGLSGLATGEKSDEGHGPDAAARAGAGNSGRSSQGRRRPPAGTGARGTAGSGGGRVSVLRSYRHSGCAHCEPAPQRGHGQIGSPRGGREPTCPNSQLSK